MKKLFLSFLMMLAMLPLAAARGNRVNIIKNDKNNFFILFLSLLF